jgi:hypothetical protein
LTAAPGNDVVLTISGASITRVSCCVAVALFESVTFTAKVELPVAVGVPEIVFPLNVNPTGNEPEVIDHVYEFDPPVATRACE